MLGSTHFFSSFSEAYSSSFHLGFEGRQYHSKVRNVKSLVRTSGKKASLGIFLFLQKKKLTIDVCCLPDTLHLQQSMNKTHTRQLQVCYLGET